MSDKDSYIYLDKDTDFTGEIASARVVLEGRMNGVVHAEKVIHLKEGARFKGEIYAGHLIADDGATCHGELRVNSGNKSETEDRTGNRNGNRGKEKNVLMRVASSMTAL